MRGYGRRLRTLLSAAGYELHRRGRGDHDIWRHPTEGAPVTVPVNIDSRHTANEILKSCGLPKAF